MAQKFTVDPRFAATSSSNAATNSFSQDEDDDDTLSTESGTSSEDEVEKDNKAELERLAAEFAAEVAKAKAAAENGEGCLMCGS
jgi:hypothetical protein